MANGEGPRGTFGGSYHGPSPSLNPCPSLYPRPPLASSPSIPHTISISTHSSPNTGTLFSDDPFLSTLFPSPPQVCYRRNPTLSSTLVKAALPGHPPPPGETTPINIKTIKSRTHKCTNPHCKACPNALGKRILYSSVQNTVYLHRALHLHGQIPHLLHPLRQVQQDVHRSYFPNHKATFQRTLLCLHKETTNPPVPPLFT